MNKSKFLCLVILTYLGIYVTTIIYIYILYIIYICNKIYVTKKEDLNLKESNEVYMRGFGDRKEKEEGM